MSLSVPVRLLLRLWVPLLMLLLLAACAGGAGREFKTPYAAGRHVQTAVQCVPYARQVSGIQIYGDAHTWWDQADGRFRKGYLPQPGAVLVLARTERMRYGHLAVVKRVLNPREIEVTHSNWGNTPDSRRMIYDRMRVEDLSPRNDWSRVRFWNYHISSYGLPYEARGFIYPH